MEVHHQQIFLTETLTPGNNSWKGMVSIVTQTCAVGKILKLLNTTSLDAKGISMETMICKQRSVQVKD